MTDVEFTVQNIMPSALDGYQLRTVAVSSNGWPGGFSAHFKTLVDPGAFHTIIGKSVMEQILQSVFDSEGNPLQTVDTVKSFGAYGKMRLSPRYIIPQMYFGPIHLFDVSVIVSDGDNFQCLLGRSVLHQCILTLNPALNNMKFEFKAELEPRKQLTGGMKPFSKVCEYAEFAPDSVCDSEW